MEKLQAEPMVEFEGKISDESEHAPMLANMTANMLADQLAIEQAKEMGFTDEELALLSSGDNLP
jgi:hypothetical protein